MKQEKEPTKDDVIAFLRESLEIAELRANLQKYNTEIAQGRAEELKALMFISQVTNPKEQELVEHTVTQDDITNNPELSEEGFNVGDNIKIPSEIKRRLKKETPKE